MNRLTLLTTGTVVLLSCAAIALRKKSLRRRRRLLKATARQKLLKDVSEDPVFDVIVVGGGTAGCVLAARLSEEPNLKVVLLEAGRSGIANEYTRIPGAGFRVLRSKDDYAFFTTEQPHAGGKRKYWPRAKLLGGCSSINAMIFHEGDPSDYDEWANIIGDESWAYKNFKKYFLKFEKFIPSKAYPDVDASLRGSNGPVEVGFFGYASRLGTAFIDACEAVGIPRVADFNTTKGSIGVAKLMTYIDNKGERVTTESAYLTPEVLARPNLTVLTHTQATKILIETDASEKSGRKRAVGVEVALAKNEGIEEREKEVEVERVVLRCRKEVVLSAGAVHTPHILLLSGIGPPAHLSTHHIPLIHPLPGVGQHLEDHVVAWLRFRSCSSYPPGYYSLNYLKPRSVGEALKFGWEVLRWKVWGRGALTCNVVDTAAFVRSTDPALFPSSSSGAEEKKEESPQDPSGSAPDIELLASPMGWDDHGFGEVPRGGLCSVGVALLKPTSTGSITLKSSDPFDAPVIDPNYLATAHDLAILVRGLKLALRVASTPPYSSLLSTPSSSSDNEFLDNKLLISPSSPSSPSFPSESESETTVTDLDLEQIARTRLETVYHPTSTARMAPLSQGGVVDASLRVYGVEGLRIADASVFSRIVAGHTTAPVIAIAEKAADMIKESCATT